jgi:multiple sugar transport system permease protein
MKKKLDRNSIYPYLLCLPAVLLVASVSVYPTLYSFYLSMTRFRSGQTQFVGLRNYAILLTSPYFFESLKATLVFLVFFVAITVVIALLAALMLNSGIALSGLYMTVIFLPWVLSEITSGVVWRWFFYRDYGVLQNLLGPLFDNVTIITTPGGAMGVVTAATIWRSISFGMLLLLAGLQTIPRDVYEAANVDGAVGFMQFRCITWPLLFPTLIVTVSFLTIQAVNNVGMFLAITDGGPGRSTEVLSLYMYREAIQYFNLGYGASLSVLLLVLNALLAAVYLRFLGRENALAA